MTKKCNACQIVRPLSEFHASSSGKYGRVAVCKGCYREKSSTPEARARARAAAERHRQKEGYKEKHASYRKTPRGVFQLYAASSKRKDLAFDLTLESLLSDFWGKPCHYCGECPSIIGIDRLDSGKGYVGGNMVPCCSMCNFMKGASGRDDFLAKCRAVAKHSEK